MRERARDKGRLMDIIEYANNVTMLIDGFTYEQLVADKRTYYSVMKNVEVVGEAASVRLDLQSSRMEYMDFQSDKAHYKCLYSQQSDCKSDRTRNWQTGKKNKID